MDRTTLFCPAKINLFLEVLDKRPDGYHNIDSVMQAVDLCDLVTVCTAPGSGRITLACSDPLLPADGGNLAFRAARAYLTAAGVSDVDVDIRIEKHIPVSAGLAGGSTDCAGVLRSLRALIGGLSESGLYELGASLGADVPFCLKGGCARTRGIGELLSPLPSVSPAYTFLIAKGGEGVSTAEAYRHMDVPRTKRTADALCAGLESGDAAAVFGNLYNAFESFVLPVRQRASFARDVMLHTGAVGALMSGSGPSVFGIYPDGEDASRVCETLAGMGYQAYVCCPMS